ncbi:diguanylate cyclase [Roseateles puraquae]|uniref:diguanylate cyclase n=1 Tax=Roseateles puraquae TaxID=431059 RepID=A0A254NM09_9BURK|nr:diguanylate cyclase [Roseateles puraquae]MDG0855678.1 diguanylate cyclase [Roseateles puraquae]OWR05878.1 diguanylate cyclase response regulator [Roseateles puraquae]
MPLTQPGAAPLQPAIGPPGRRPRLLIVDDQPVNIQALHRVFAGDCQVLMATDGARALQVCRERQPDLVLLDVQMPGMDGHELCAELKADPLLRAIPIIFVTAQDRPEDETRALDAGAADFITKPFNPTVVRARVRTQLTLKAQADLLRELAFIDGLTGVHNRRHFDERFIAEARRAQRSRSPLAIVLADVDHFKRYNDALGHLAGDDCLRRVAGALRTCLRRPTDLLARYGGEEFVSLLPDTDLAGAIGVAQLMEDTVRALALPHPGVQGSVTISLGVSAGLQPTGLVAAADRALYLAKAAGRGRVNWVEG